jgi:hypothetical protein
VHRRTRRIETDSAVNQFTESAQQFRYEEAVQSERLMEIGSNQPTTRIQSEFALHQQIRDRRPGSVESATLACASHPLRILIYFGFKCRPIGKHPIKRGQPCRPPPKRALSLLQQVWSTVTSVTRAGF